MSSSVFPVSPNPSQKEVKYPDRIERWLEKLESKGPETHESEHNRTTENKIRASGPTTPKGKTDLRSTLYEVSPTDSTFSGHSIFDRPLRKNLFGSPTPIRDEDSDTTSVDIGDWHPTSKNERPLERLVPFNFSPQPSAPSVSLDSHNSSLNSDTDILTTAPNRDTQPTLPTHDPNEPRPVWITSCLQCTLAGLPCSRTYPYCSRCKRCDRPEECLLHRQCFVFEAIDPTEVGGCKAPILLKVKGEDDTIRKRKVELAVNMDG